MGILTDLFVELFCKNRGPGYGIKVINSTADLTSIEVEIAFLAGRTYCCYEPGCHLPRNSKRLMQLGADRSITIPEDVLIKWHFRIEAGAKFDAAGRPIESADHEFDVIGLPPHEPISD